MQAKRVVVAHGCKEFTEEEMKMIKEDVAAWKRRREARIKEANGETYTPPQYKAVFLDTDQSLRMLPERDGEDDAS